MDPNTDLRDSQAPAQAPAQAQAQAPAQIEVPVDVERRLAAMKTETDVHGMVTCLTETDRDVSPPCADKGRDEYVQAQIT